MRFTRLRKRIGYRLIGGPTTAINDQRERISRILYDRLDGKVAYGPFRGLRMNYRFCWGGRVFAHKLFGVYE